MTGRSEDLRKKILGLVEEYFIESQKLEPFDREESRVPYAGRIYGAEEMQRLVETSLDFWLTHGTVCDEFEDRLGRYLGVKRCYLVNSGSSANLLAVAALCSPSLGARQLKEGDEVITVAAGFPATVAPIVQHRLVPVFVDVEFPTYNIDPSQLQRALSSRTRAVMLAHTLGNPFNLDAVQSFCRTNDLWLVEDNCDALGAKYRGRLTGSFGDLGTSSFYPAHHITTGEGGAVYLNDSKLGLAVASLRGWGRDCWCSGGKDNTCGKRFSQSLGDLPHGYDHKYVYSHFGYNLKATEMQAAVGCAQLDRLPDFIEARNRNFAALYDRLEHLGNELILPEPTEHSEPSWFGFPLTVREDVGLTRDRVVAFLEENRIQTRPLFAGNLLRHPCFDQMRKSGDGYRVVGDLTNTDLIMNNTFWVGVYPGLTADMIEYVAEKIEQSVGMSA